MNVAVLIAIVLIGSVIPVELVFEFRRARSFDAEPNRPKQRMHNSFMKTKELPRERNPFLLTGKRRWRLFRWIWAAQRARWPKQWRSWRCPIPLRRTSPLTHIAGTIEASTGNAAWCERAILFRTR